MKNYVLMLMLFLVSISFAGTSVYPTFDWNRSLWMDYVSDDTPIFVDSHTALGLTNPSVGDTKYSFKFEVSVGEVYFNGGDYRDNINVSYSAYTNLLIINGIHNGPGGPLNDVLMVGDGIVNVYERDCVCGSPYEYIGSFTVGEPIPEPCSLLLLGSGYVLFSFAKKRKL